MPALVDAAGVERACVRELLAACADVDEADEYGNTALMVASEKQPLAGRPPGHRGGR